MLQYAMSAAQSRRPSRKPCRLVIGLFLAAAVAGCSGGDGQPKQAKEPKEARQQAPQPQSTPQQAPQPPKKTPPEPAGPQGTQPPETPPPLQLAPTPDADSAALNREAMEVAEELLEQYPNDPAVHALMGSVYHNRGDSAEAVRYLEKCLELDPDRADAYSMLALVAWRQGDPQRCVALCRQALKINPKMLDVYHRLGEALMDLGKTEELIETMQQALSAVPRSSQSHYLLGQGYLQVRQYAKAKENFLATIAIRPDHTQAYFGLFTASSRLGERDEARRYREEFQRLEAADRKALRDNNRSPTGGIALVRQTVARTLTGAGQICRSHAARTKAEAHWRRAADLDPENMLARASLLAGFASEGKTDEALKFFKQLAKRQPDSAVNHYFLGQIYARSNLPGAAEAAYRKMTELWPEKPHGYVMLAVFFLQSGREAGEAKTLAAKAVELEPVAENYVLLARACRAEGDRSGALAAIARALALDPGNAEYERIRWQIEEGR